MRNLINTLTNVGLSEKEASVYLSLLKIKSGTAYRVAKDSTLKKPTVYVVLESLREKGFVLKTPSKKGTIYTVKSPEEIVHVAEQKLSKVVEVLPILKNIFMDQKSNINVYYFEGMSGVKELLYYKLEETIDDDMVGFFAKVGENNVELVSMLEEWGKALTKTGSKIYGITPDDSGTKAVATRSLDLFENIKYVEEEKYSSNISIDVVKDFIRIVDLKNINGVIIDNREVAKTFRQIFYMIWDNLKQKEKMSQTLAQTKKAC